MRRCGGSVNDVTDAVVRCTLSAVTGHRSARGCRLPATRARSAASRTGAPHVAHTAVWSPPARAAGVIWRPVPVTGQDTPRRCGAYHHEGQASVERATAAAG